MTSDDRSIKDHASAVLQGCRVQLSSLSHPQTHQIEHLVGHLDTCPDPPPTTIVPIEYIMVGGLGLMDVEVGLIYDTIFKPSRAQKKVFFVIAMHQL